MMDMRRLKKACSDVLIFLRAFYVLVLVIKLLNNFVGDIGIVYYNVS